MVDIIMKETLLGLIGNFTWLFGQEFNQRTKSDARTCQ
jgi:hypothetical protein